MKKKIILLFLKLNLGVFLYSQNFLEKELEGGPYEGEKFPIRLYNGDTTFTYNFFAKQFLEMNIESLFESYYEPVMNQFLSTGDFSFPDNYVFTFLGNSWIWNKYYYNGINITDSFFPGKTLHKLPPLGSDLTLNPIKGNFYQNTARRGRFFYQRLIVGGLGSHIPFYRIFFDSYTQEAPQISSNPPDFSKTTQQALRWYIRDIFDFTYANSSYVLLNDIFLNIQNRDFLSFDEKGYTGTFPESTINLTINGEIFKKDKVVSHLGFLLSYQHRSRLLAEYYYNEEETATYNNLAFTFYYKNEDLLYQHHAFNLVTKKIVKNNINHSRNVYDQTGEGLYPFYPSVNTFEFSQDSQLAYGFNFVYQDFFKLSTRFNNVLVVVNPIDRDYKTTSYFKSPTEILSLYVSDWKSSQVLYFLFDDELVFEINKVEKNGFKIDGEVGLDVDGFAILKEERYFSLGPRFNLGMNVLNDDFQFFRLELGRVNTPFSSEYANFLADGYQSAKNYVWNDDNDNLTLDAGEQSSTLHSTTGGAYHSLDNSFKAPHYYYIDIPYNISIPTYNRALPFVHLGTVAHYRIFKNQVWLKPNSSNEGETRVINGQSVYFPALGEKNYTVYNLPSSFFPGGSHWFNDSPMYLGATLKLAIQGIRFYGSFSFSAYLINGITTLGNGPLHNSGGTIAESQADPNQTYKNVGRLDGDRAYIGKFFINYWPTDFLAITTTLKYQDGQPIGKWGYHLDSTTKSVAYLRESVSGDNLLLYNGEFGTREDAWWIFDLKFAFFLSIEREKDFSLYLNFYNLLDLGRSLLEYSFSKPGEATRDVIEIQIPRGIELGFRYEY